MWRGVNRRYTADAHGGRFIAVDIKPLLGRVPWGLTLFGACLALAGLGAGPWSVDATLSGSRART